MPRNTKTNGKKLIDTYVKTMDIQYVEQCQMQELYLNEKLNDEFYDYNKSLKFTRTWEILRTMDDYAARNLIFLHNACNSRYKETLEALSGTGLVQYKNEATLRVMITNARKKIKELYKDRYGG